jgi:hypothetical protein
VAFHLKWRKLNVNPAVDAAVNEVRNAYPEGLGRALVAVADAEGNAYSDGAHARARAADWAVRP